MKAFTVAVIAAVFYTVHLFMRKAVARIGEARHVNIYRIRYLQRTLSIFLSVAAFLVLLLLMGIEYSQVSVFLSSVFAVLGIALFAQWSILSNITASIIIFFGFPYRVGDHVKVIDKDEDVSGIIEEIGLFHVLIKRDDESVISYPNSLILQKGVIKFSASNNKKAEANETGETATNTND